MTSKGISILLAALLAGSTPAGAAGFGGSDPFDFLFMDAGARQAALGGAFAAGQNDANVLAYNPAGLATLARNEVSFMHVSHFQGVTREHIAAARPGIGLSLDYLNFGELQRTTLSNPDGSGLTGFTPNVLSAALGVAFPITETWSFGIAAKHVRQKIDDVTASAYAGDIGVQGLILDDPYLIFGLAVQNAGPKVKFEKGKEPLPLNIKAGAAMRTGLLGLPLGLTLDLNQSPNGPLHVNAGVATAVAEALALRAGYNGRNDAGPGLTFGFGLRFQKYSFDYAFIPFGDLGQSHMMSFGMRWGTYAAGSEDENYIFR